MTPTLAMPLSFLPLLFPKFNYRMGLVIGLLHRSPVPGLTLHRHATAVEFYRLTKRTTTIAKSNPALRRIRRRYGEYRTAAPAFHVGSSLSRRYAGDNIEPVLARVALSFGAVSGWSSNGNKFH